MCCIGHSATATKQLHQDWLHSQIQRRRCPEPLPTYTSPSKEWSLLSTGIRSERKHKFRNGMFYNKTLSIYNLKCGEECPLYKCTTGQSLHPQEYNLAWKKTQGGAGNPDSRLLVDNPSSLHSRYNALNVKLNRNRKERYSDQIMSTIT